MLSETKVELVKGFNKRIVAGGALAAAVITLFPWVPVPAAADTLQQRVKLAGVTTIVGDRTASMKVRLPEDVDPHGNYEGPVDRQPGYQMAGDGRLVGFVLTREQRGTPLGEGPTLYGWRLGRCMQPGCEARNSFVVVLASNTRNKNGSQVIPKGNYRLFVIADRAKVRLRLELSGLTGRVRVRPTQPVTAQLHSLRPQLIHSGDEMTYWAGRNSALNGVPGFALAALWVDARDVQGAAGSCVYMETPPPPEDVAYVPPCPYADYSSPTFVNADYNELGFFSLALPKGMGLWQTVSEPARNAGAIGLWMKF